MIKIFVLLCIRDKLATFVTQKLNSIPKEKILVMKLLYSGIKPLLMLLFFILSILNSNAIVVDSLYISLLTCTPGEEVYAHFGHSAIRVKFIGHNDNNVNSIVSQDIVFNYGMFNYNADNFIYRFVKGETDYQLGVDETSYFLTRYAEKNIDVYEQQLNLTESEKESLFDALVVNSRPENRVYRYNFLYDNCTTRARDIIEKSVDGSVQYDFSNNEMSDSTYNYNVETMREILHQFLQNDKWLKFGIDFVLGEEVDKPVDKRLQMFIPEFYMHYAQNASILTSSGTKKSLVDGETTKLVTSTQIDKSKSVVTPFFTFGILFVIMTFVTVLQVAGKIEEGLFTRSLDAVLLCTQGLAGIIVAFLFFLSEHPAVGTNWLVIIFNPLPLLWTPFMIYRRIKKQYDTIYVVYTVILAAFILAMPFIPQRFNSAMYSLAFILLLRGIANVIQLYKQKKITTKVL